MSSSSSSTTMATTTILTMAAEALQQDRLKELVTVEAVELELKAGAWSGEKEKSRLLRHGAKLHFDAVFLKAKGETKTEQEAKDLAATSVKAWRLKNGGLLQGELPTGAAAATAIALAPGAGSTGSVVMEDSAVTVQARTDAAHIWVLMSALSEAMRHADIESLEGFVHRLLTLQPALERLEWYSQKELQVYLDTIAKHIEVRVGAGKLQGEPVAEELADDAFQLACWMALQMPTVGAGTEAAAGAGGEVKLAQVSEEPAKAPVEEALESNPKAATTIKATTTTTNNNNNNNNNDTAPAAPAPVVIKKAPTKMGEKGGKKGPKASAKKGIDPTDEEIAALFIEFDVDLSAKEAKKEEALVVASVSTEKVGGKNKGKKKKGKKDKAVADSTTNTEETETPKKETKAHPSKANKAKKLAASRAGTHTVKTKPAATTTTASITDSTTRTSRTRSTRASSGASDVMASSASGLEAHHRSTGSTGSDATSSTAAVAAAEKPKDGQDEMGSSRVAPSGAGALESEEQGEGDEQLASVPRADGALVPTDSSTQQQQQQQPLVADLPAAVAEDGPDNEPAQAALNASSSAPPSPTADPSSGMPPALAVPSSLAPAPTNPAVEEGQVDNEEVRVVPQADAEEQSPILLANNTPVVTDDAPPSLPSALVEAEEQDDEQEEEALRRWGLCGLVMGCYSTIVCAAAKVVLAGFLAGSEPRYSAQPTYRTLTFLEGEKAMSEAEAIKAVIEFEIAEAEQAAALALDSSSSSSPSSSTTSSSNTPTLPPSPALNADVVAAGSSNTNETEALEPMNGAASSNPPSATSSSSPSLLARATGVVLFPAKCAVGLTVGSVKLVGKTVKKAVGLVKGVVVGSAKMFGRAVGVGFGVSKGVGLAVWRVLRGVGMALRRMVRVLLGGRWSEDVVEMEGEEEEGEGGVGPVVEGVGVGDGE